MMSRMDDVTVAIPWRETPDRVRAFGRVLRFWELEMGLKVVTAAPDFGPFNLAQARNRAVQLVNTEIVIVADADTLVQVPAVMTAHATLRGEVVWLFDDYRIIDADWIPFDDAMTAPRKTCFCGQMKPGCCGAVAGAFMCRTETYWRLGGTDERFGSIWGGEDIAFAASAGTLTGARNVQGWAVAFDHDYQDPSEQLAARDVTANRAWTRIYQDAAGDREAMEELLAARDPRPRGIEEWLQRWGQPEPVLWPPRPRDVEWL